MLLSLEELSESHGPIDDLKCEVAFTYLVARGVREPWVDGDFGSQGCHVGFLV